MHRAFGTSPPLALGKAKKPRSPSCRQMLALVKTVTSQTVENMKLLLRQAAFCATD